MINLVSEICQGLTYEMACFRMAKKVCFVMGDKENLNGYAWNAEGQKACEKKGARF